MIHILSVIFSKSESIRNTRNYMLGQVVNKALHLLTMPLTTFLLGTVDYGQHGTYQATISIFIVILPLCLFRGVTRFYYDDQFDAKEMMGTQFVMMIITMTLLSVFLLFTIRLWNGLIGLTYLLTFFMIIHCYAESIINFYLAFLQSQKQSKKYASFSVTLSVLSTFIGLFSMFLFQDERWMGLVYTNLILRIVFALYASVSMFPSLKFKSTKEMRKEVWRFCLPLLPHMLSSVFLNSLDRIMIKDMVGPHEAGLYTFAYNFGSMINIIVYAINQTWGPEFFELMNKKNYTGIQRKVLFYLNCLLSCTLLVVMFSKEVTLIFARKEEFHIAYRMIPMISYGYLLFYVYSSLSNYAVYHKKTSFLSIVSCTSALVNVALNYYGIIAFGYEIAAVTTVISFLFQYYFYYICDKYFYHIAINNSSYFIKKSLLFIVVTYIFFLGFDSLISNIVFQFVIKGVFSILINFLIWNDKDKFGKILIN